MSKDPFVHDPGLFKFSQNAIWQTKDGRRLKISEMDENHIYNCVKMVFRKISLSDRDINVILIFESSRSI